MTHRVFMLSFSKILISVCLMVLVPNVGNTHQQNICYDLCLCTSYFSCQGTNGQGRGSTAVIEAVDTIIRSKAIMTL